MQRIGVFVCHCGTNIAGTVDVKAVAAALGNEPGVVVAEDYQYMCSQAGQDLIKNAIRENNLNGVVFALGFPHRYKPLQCLFQSDFGVAPDFFFLHWLFLYGTDIRQPQQGGKCQVVL